MRRICVVTGTRAEYGLLRRLLSLIAHAQELDYLLIVTGAHLAPELGDTQREIESNGFSISERVHMLLSSDRPVAVGKSMGLCMIGVAEALDRHEPDFMVVLGDRYEMLAAVSAALVARVPVAHLAGGDTTEGAYDESFRHAITKMSHLHFVTNEPARRRVLAMGENPQHVFNVGFTGIDDLRDLDFIERQQLEDELSHEFRKRNVLVTFHPETLGKRPATRDLAEVLGGLKRLGDDVGFFITYPNADTEGRSLIPIIERFVDDCPAAVSIASLGRRRYLSLMRLVDAVVGNSSSGLYEAPSFGVPTVNIGDRQKGRIAADSVISVACDEHEIAAAIERAFDMDCSGVVNPYGSGGASEAIVETLEKWKDPPALIRKPFFEVIP